ncbi:MAG TPA: helix-hairpin-helix domain-containing protein, partial [Thermoanaerobaculia bacterium]|nr:helix-hairpin-helix domain-containing protein [Thermoanaerobaculia bacterium]
AQSVSLDAPSSAVAVDLLIRAVGDSARFRLDLRPDMAGKPDSRSLLSRPAELAIDPKADGSASWVSVPLPEEFRFLGSIPYWVVLQSLAGTLHWSAGRAPFPRLGMQRTDDGSLSWRLATPVPASGIVLSSAPAGALAGLFRLRSKPKDFQVPIAILAGGPTTISRVTLDRFAHLRRVDFSPNEELARAVSESLVQSTSGDPPPCPEGEHLANADFTHWFEATTDESILPAEWSLGGGTIARLPRAEQGSDTGLGLSFSQRQTSSIARLTGLRVEDSRLTPADAALSQVVPVAASCRYQFSFHALADVPGAVAELSWRNSLGKFQRVDTVPITDRVELPTGVARPVSVPAPEHRIRVKAPEGAAQAEVRFRVPASGTADITDASLEVTGNRLDNFNLQALENSLPIGWTLNPNGADKVLVEVRANLAIVANAGTADAELTQNLPVNAGEDFLFQFDGSVVGSEAAPRIELHYLTANGPPAAATIVVNLSPEDSHVPAGGTVPDQATRAEVHLVLPARTAIGVRSMSLQLSKLATVPIAFIAEAPGELKVSELRVAYDRVPVPPPPVPPEGLRPPTPADQAAGEEPDRDSYCGHCGTRNSLKNTGVSRSPAGRPTIVGDCRNCGAQIVSLGGRPVMPHEVERSFPATRAFFPKPIPTALTSIVGIGAARERGLIRAGIDSLGKLAAARPADVARAMIGVGARNAPHFIAEARKLVEARRLAEQQSNPWSSIRWS